MPTNYYRADCQKFNCPLNMSCSRTATQITYSDGYVQGAPIDLFFVLDAASGADMRAGRPLAGAEGRVLRSTIEKYIPKGTSWAVGCLVRGWAVDRLTIPQTLMHASLVDVAPQRIDRAKTIPISSHPERNALVENCKKFVFNEIFALRPKKLVLMGTFVKQAFFPNDARNIVALQEADDLVWQGFPVSILPSHSMLMRSPSNLPEWEQKVRRVCRNEPIQKDKTPGKTHILRTVPEVLDFINFLRTECSDVSFDTETRNLNKRYGNTLGTMQFAFNGQEGYVVPWAHGQSPFSPDELNELKPHFVRLFTEPSSVKTWIGHGLKFEQNVIKATFDCYVNSAPMFDTWPALFLLDENRMERVQAFKYGPYSLKQAAYDYCNFDGYDVDILKTREEGGLFDLPLERLAEYGSMDVYVNFRLKEALVAESKVQGYYEAFLELLYSLYDGMIETFAEIEYNGMHTDRQYVRDLASKRSPLLKRIAEIENSLKSNQHVVRTNDSLLVKNDPTVRDIQPVFGKPWVFSFAKQGHPQALFFDQMGLTELRKTEAQTRSVDDDWQKANKDIPLVETFSEWIELRKMYDSFVKQIYDYLDPAGINVDHSRDSRIRPNFNLSSVVTGRVSCNKPNMQAIPRADSGPKKMIKNMWQALPGHAMIQLDYKANEMRWVTIASGDLAMAEKFNKGKSLLDEFRCNPTDEKLKLAELWSDIHKQNASSAFRIPIESVTKDLRQKAKGVSFGILYDSSVKAIAEQYGMTYEEAESMMQTFFAAHPEIVKWKYQMKNDAMNLGYAQAPHGRRRRFPIFNMYRDDYGRFDQSRVPREVNFLVAEALRQASNAPIQGIASDAAMIGATLFFQNEIQKNKRPWILQNAVHDSAIIQVPVEDLKTAVIEAEKQFSEEVMNYMNIMWGINFICPIEVELEVGLKWGDLEKWNYHPDELTKMTSKIRQHWDLVS